MIRFDHVSKTYPGGTRAVDDFSLTIEQGSTTVFLGTSGCGKTTLMRMVNAMVTPTSGTVFVRDQDVTGADPVRVAGPGGLVLDEDGTPVGMLARDGDEASAASGVSPTPRGSARPVAGERS